MDSNTNEVQASGGDSCPIFVSAAASVPSQLVAQQPDRTKRSKVFVTDGKDAALTGVCVFFTRANTSKTVTSENIHRVSHFSLYL